jgi:hypothetical protein
MSLFLCFSWPIRNHICVLGIKLVYCLYSGSSVVRFTASAGLYDPTSHVQVNQIPERHAETNKTQTPGYVALSKNNQSRSGHL